MNTTTFNYIDIATKKLKIAKDFSVNYFSNCIPKNAVYGRITRNLYIYITDFEQFYTKSTRFSIYILDSRKDTRFHKTIISKHSKWYNMIFAFVDYHELRRTKVVWQLCINRIEKPERKEPQTKTGYMYKTGVYSQNRVDPFCHECIDTDVTYKPRRYV